MTDFIYSPNVLL